jgi:hypothetical protein
MCVPLCQGTARTYRNQLHMGAMSRSQTHQLSYRSNNKMTLNNFMKQVTV